MCKKLVQSFVQIGSSAKVEIRHLQTFLHSYATSIILRFTFPLILFKKTTNCEVMFFSYPQVYGFTLYKVTELYQR